MLDLIIRGLATFYLATAGVELFAYVFHRFNPDGTPIDRAKFKFLFYKPFNCEFCLSFWFAIFVGISIPFVFVDYVIQVPAIAGISALLGGVYSRWKVYIG